MNVKAHRLPDAIAAYRKALAIDPEHEGAAWSLALAYQDAGKLDEARAGFERVRQLNPRDARPLYQLAGLSARHGDFAGAAATLEEGLKLAGRSLGVSRQARRSAARTQAARRGASRTARGDQTQTGAVDGPLRSRVDPRSNAVNGGRRWSPTRPRSA
jgi:tetratricopeptide (TPR) repeat protein